MNHGRFFEFDFESSLLQKGVTVFNYRWLKHDLIHKGIKTPHYPIYVSVSPEVISFKLHYIEDNETDSKNSFVKHYHNTIIELRLSQNIEVSEGLAEVLNNTYWAQFPVNENTQLRKTIEKSFENQDCEEYGFADFPCFAPEGKERYITTSNNPKTHFLRKLILDFLFDFEFTDVFKNAAYYYALSVKLKENYLFNALINKTRYYYYRTELCQREVVERCYGATDTKKCEQSLISFFELYSKTECKWMESILDERAVHAFHNSPWFNEVSEELEQVYFSNRLKHWKKNDDHKARVIPAVGKSDSIVSVVESVRKRNAWKTYLKRIGATDDSFQLTVSNLLSLIRRRYYKDKKTRKTKKSEFHNAVYGHSNTAKKAAAWEVSHYHFIGLWRLWFGDTATMWWSVIALGLMFGIIFFASCILHESPNLSAYWFIIPASTVTSLFVLSTYIVRRHYRSTWGIGGMAVILPRLLAAVIAAWFTMGMSEDLFRNFYDISCLNPAVTIIISIVTLFFVFYEARQINPFDGFKHQITSSLIVILMAYVYSFIVGIMVYEYFGVQVLNGMKTSGGICCCSHSITNGENNWWFIAQFSFFATFIGIFLQLMFQGKSVTASK
ncbi:MAG: hypothetical protein IJR13_07220 [Bacteroidales bacterium]|nr:hypothetical protein [Bacteroidales bacterium]